MKIRKTYKALFGLNDFGQEAVAKASIVADTVGTKVLCLYQTQETIADSSQWAHYMEISANPIELRLFNKKLKKVLGISVDWKEQ